MEDVETTLDVDVDERCVSVSSIWYLLLLPTFIIIIIQAKFRCSLFGALYKLLLEENSHLCEI